MAADIPTKEPLQFRAGDTVQWVKSLADYSAADYSLTYYLVGKQKITITASADGTDFSVTISAATTATLEAGDYWIEGKVTGADGTFTVYAAAIRVLPNFASDTVAPGFDGRSENRKIRDALREMVKGSAQFPEIAYTIFGERSAQLVPIKDRLDALARFEALVGEEDRQAAADRGEGTGIYIRFRSPR